MSNKIQVSLPEEELDWIQLRQELGPIVEVETTKEKLQRKIKENPLVPLGCLATTAALTAGLYNFRTGNRKMSQIMMRTRIAAQGFTVLALVAGVVMTYTDKK
ncbi:HIG1 domain family member 2A, mitochondrial [Drosophila subpulchrella]|uniref:HIG1 domain family member 2A, mitochondrial n=1 Tax=Drosophila subpulchrella TaxID=1486046 RepID=UPI0018A16E5F|nr:HIG1 domain family member 2A, mitochondrial [Drosophila subpulchrella]